MKSSHRYDPFGQLIETTYESTLSPGLLPAHVAKNYVTRSMTGCPLPETVQRVVRVQAGSPTTTACVDSLGRTVQTRSTADAAGAEMLVDTEFDALGRMIRQSEPYLSTQTSYWTTYGSFDVLGRPGRKVLPTNPNDHGTLTIEYTYNGLTTDIQLCGANDLTPHGGCLTAMRRKDAMGNYIATRDARGGKTDFWFDAMGNVLAIEDAANVETLAYYDDLGRRTRIDDPNQGDWRFEYNGLGDLRLQTDARGIETHYTWDALSRQESRWADADVDGNGTIERIVDTYTWDPLQSSTSTIVYGVAGSAKREVRNSDGSLRYVERRTTFEYDELGRRTRASVEQQNSGLQPYAIVWRYDAQNGRLSEMAWNDQEGVAYRYDGTYGFLRYEHDSRTGDLYREVEARDARGRVIEATLGDVLTAEHTPFRQTANGAVSAISSMVPWRSTSTTRMTCSEISSRDRSAR